MKKQWKPLQTIENIWKSLKIIEIIENQQKSMKIIRIHLNVIWKSLKIVDNHWTQLKISWKSFSSIANHWKSLSTLKIIVNNSQSLNIMENYWIEHNCTYFRRIDNNSKSLTIVEIHWESFRINVIHMLKIDFRARVFFDFFLPAAPAGAT